jgi:glycosyltransferase involved in cell wall biosynthesis
LAVTLGIEEKVHFGGFQRNWRERAAEFKYFVFPSTTEGMPNAVVEAMAEGLPVIGSDIPALRNLIGDGKEGFLFTKNDISHFRRILETLPCGGKEYERLSGNALASARRFSVEKMVGHYEKLYTDLANPGKGNFE